MSGLWQCVSGDEWRCTTSWCQVDGCFDSDFPGTLSIQNVLVKNGKLDEARLGDILRTTWNEFKGSGIEISLDGNIKCLPLLNALQAERILKFELVEAPHATCARILDISAPQTRADDAPNQLDHLEEKSWWRVW